jgi:hypothetical protein
LTAKGSGGVPPATALRAPCRIVRVVRTETGFVVFGETHGEGVHPVTCRLMHVPVASPITEADAEREANDLARRFGARMRPSYKGPSYVIDSACAVVEVRPTTPEPGADS